MPKRIAYLTNQYPGVSHSFIRREIAGLERRGFAVTRLSLRGWDAPIADDEDRAERTRTHYILRRGVLPLLAAAIAVMAGRPFGFARGLALALRLSIRADRGLPHHIAYFLEACALVRLLDAAPVDHVHAHFGSNAAEVAMLAHALGGPPYSFTIHGPEEFDKPVALKLAEKVGQAAFVVVVSSFGRSQLFRWIALADWPKVHIVHCALDDAFHADSDAPLPAVPRMVCVGRLCEQKGQLVLIEACHRLAQTGTPFELILIGDGAMRAQIEERIERHGLSAQIRIAGWMSAGDIRRELLASRGMVLASFAEGLPVVIMEAMALRRPVISTFIAGIPELVRPGIDGFLVPAGDVQALSDAMQALLTLEDAAVADMGEAARARVLERHAIDRECAKLARLFEGTGR